MATSTQVAVAAPAAGPFARWHLLSLDAPTVAVVWTWFVARAYRVDLPPASLAAMVVAVWALYAGDRLLDARLFDSDLPLQPNELEARHLFHYRHRRAFLAGIGLAAAVLGALVPALGLAAIRLYLVEGALLAAWFAVLHGTHSAHRLPKEIAVGLFFSAAIFIPTVTRRPGTLNLGLFLSAILFAALCGLNCLFIYAWEHDGADRQPARRAHATTRLAVARLPPLAVLLAAAGLAASCISRQSLLIAAACALAAALLLVLDRRRRWFSRTHLRAAADLALLTPLLLAPFLR
jgi:hypothetical protein